ncbi:MAG TPA: peroxide stress protein YaaA [Pseudonocardiaceae bacterium]|nr:peroxide stress protein YaaA [Pseudonocardiaceae bacterium]
MLVLLPPSETKQLGGDGPPLGLEAIGLDALSHADLTPVRRKLIDELVALAGDRSAGLAALGLSQHQHGELERNGALWSAPTLPALRRYTGVLYAALDAQSLRPAQCDRLMVASALFGLLRADDRIPAYRLSAASTLPGLGSVRSVWRPMLGPLLAGFPGLVVDLRSGGYVALGPVPGAVTVQVISDDGHGRRRTISHHNKAHKGRLARLLATAPGEVCDAEAVAHIARRGGLRVHRSAERALEIVVAQ